jgi:hypothetical protein
MPAAPRAEQERDARKRTVLESAVVTGTVIKADEIIANVGRPRAEHLQYAAEIIAAIPSALRQAVQEPYGARAVIYCLLLDRDDAIQQRQLMHLQSEGDRGIYELTRTLSASIAGLPTESRLPLVDLALPALRGLSDEQYRMFRRNLDALVRMDRRINLFEWALRQILLHNLEPQFTNRQPRAVRHTALEAVRTHIEVLLSLLVNACVRDEPERAAAFAAACKELEMPALRRHSPDGMDLETLGGALEELALLKPLLKPRLLKACLACITRDREYSPEEMELMRALADTLDCPMPVYFGARRRA